MNTHPPADPTFDRWILAGESARNYWRDLWDYRELFLFLAWKGCRRALQADCCGHRMGADAPLLSMIIMTVIFGRVAGLPSISDTPYAIMVFAALLPWQFFPVPLPMPGRALSPTGT